MVWDRNEGRYTTVLPDGVVAHARKVEGGWELSVPALWIQELIRNVHLKTWLTAQPIVERVLEAKLHWRDPHEAPSGTVQDLPHLLGQGLQAEGLLEDHEP